MEQEDIRLAVDWPDHRKTRRLRAFHEDAPYCLLRLWRFARRRRPDGVLHGLTAEDIEAEAGWNGEPVKLYDALVRIGWIDDDGPHAPVLHDWLEHQPWIMASRARSAAGKEAAEIRWAAERAKKANETCDRNATAMRPQMRNDATAMPVPSVPSGPTPGIPSGIPSVPESPPVSPTDGETSPPPGGRPFVLTPSNGEPAPAAQKRRAPKPAIPAALRQQLVEDFDDLYDNVYPRHDARKESLEEFLKIRPSAEVQLEIRADVKRRKREEWAEAIAQGDMRTIPHLRKYLHTRRWER